MLSTLFPRLPRARIGSFRLALAVGAATIAAIDLAGFYPIALAVAAAVVPALILVYLQTVDVYEGEPVTVLALTVAWGVLCGGLFGFVGRALDSGQPAFPAPASQTVVHGIAIPLLATGLGLLGPLLLLRRRDFNDVLDGVTFGAASGAAFVGAQTLGGASGLLSGGLRPVGSAVSWLIQLLTVGVAQPILVAAVTAIAAGTIWLRVRASIRDRAALGPFGRPLVALSAGGLLVCAGALGRIALPAVAALIWLLVLAVVALTWMRVLIHVGLLEEAAEIPIGPPVVCPDCGARTPRHTFCATCGVALRALPGSHIPGAPDASVAPDAPTSPYQPGAPGAPDAPNDSVHDPGEEPR